MKLLQAIIHRPEGFAFVTFRLKIGIPHTSHLPEASDLAAEPVVVLNQSSWRLIAEGMDGLQF